jgi:hypothetical protein
MTLIKLHRQIYDLFQHCEIKCTGFCCGWDAFDFSEHWVQRWCEFRDEQELRAAVEELAKLHRELSDEADATEVEVTKFLRTTVIELRTRLQEMTSIVLSMMSGQSL